MSEELDRLVSQGILKSVKYSRWATPLVVVPKANGDLRLCMDCKVTINKCIEMEHYPLPRIEGIFASLSDCKIFCGLDLTGAYQQLAVSPECQELLTVNTHHGLFTFTRLNFGISSAPAIFQILHSIPNVHCYLDDILIGGRNEGSKFE